MRLYVLITSLFPGIEPFVVAEIADDRVDMSASRGTTLAGALAGVRAEIMTHEELEAYAGGKRAIDAWNAKDDAEYTRETAAIAADGGDHIERPLRHLRIVRKG